MRVSRLYSSVMLPRSRFQRHLIKVVHRLPSCQDLWVRVNFIIPQWERKPLQSSGMGMASFPGWSPFHNCHGSKVFMFDNRKRTKVKNNKIQCWRLVLASFSYNIKYRPGRENSAPDALTQTSCSAVPVCNLEPGHVAQALVPPRRDAHASFCAV